ncbi:hypothetical protein BD769DRAFT_1385259 [Suillus cothurnatus]|nr:hypothetical protein BD769DRAFT_1385259 [Suillus cothurnatus]
MNREKEDVPYLKRKRSQYDWNDALHDLNQDIINGEKSSRKHAKLKMRVDLANKVADMQEAVSRLEKAIGRQSEILMEVCNAIENHGIIDDIPDSRGSLQSTSTLEARPKPYQLISRTLMKDVTDCSCTDQVIGSTARTCTFKFSIPPTMCAPCALCLVCLMAFGKYKDAVFGLSFSFTVESNTALWINRSVGHGSLNY